MRTLFRRVRARHAFGSLGFLRPFGFLRALVSLGPVRGLGFLRPLGVGFPEPPAWRRSRVACAYLVAAALSPAAVLPPAAVHAQGVPPVSRGAVAFENVTVVPMDTERSLPDHTVVVRDGRIVAVGPTSGVQVPADARVVDGTGRYLAPALADMGVRLPDEMDPMRMIVDETLFLYLANGVTTVRSLLGAPYHVELRDEIERGEPPGPALLLGAPPLGEELLRTPGPARETVRAAREAGFDFVPVYAGMSREGWGGLLEAMEATESPGIPRAGRLPEGVGLREGIQAGISTLDGLDGFLVSTRRDDLAAGASALDRIRATDPEKLGEVARAVADAGVSVVPMQYLANHLAGWGHLSGWVDRDSVLVLPEFAYVSIQQKETWGNTAWNRAAHPDLTPESAEAHAAWHRELVGALHRAGVRILAGTDSPELFNVPGFALHRELDLLVEAGLTPYQVLRSATRSVAEYVEQELGRPGDFGVVEPGARADLLLLQKNPLESVEALRMRAGVMVRGVWLGEEEIQERLEEIASRYAAFDTD